MEKGLDAILIEVMKNELTAVAEEMSITMRQTAPAAVFPILAPEEVVMSGEVSAKSCALCRRRPRSMPLTMLPH